jgi:hypothetical protein
MKNDLWILILNNYNIQFVNNYLVSKLTKITNWKKNQIDQICSKVSSKIYLLSTIKKYLNLESRQLFYSGYILPLIDYFCVVWGNCSNEGLICILKLQKKNSKIDIRSRSHSTIWTSI